jgi:acyl-CoA thioesterase
MSTAEESSPTASAIVGKMMECDMFSQWLGIEVLLTEKGYSKLRMIIRPDMVNGFGIAHGGIAYSLADSALAFAANGHGRIAVSTQTGISHFEQLKPGEVIIAEAKESHLGNKIAHYTVLLTNNSGSLVASFTGSVFRTSKSWNLQT